MLNRLAARRVQQHRVNLALSPEQYGIRIGVSGMTVRRVEQGYTPFLSTQGKFARAMDLQVEDLFPIPDRPVRRRKPAAVTA